MSQLGRRDLALLLIGAGANGSLDDSLGGLTRLQKYLYLLEEEEKVKPVGDGFDGGEEHCYYERGDVEHYEATFWGDELRSLPVRLVALDDFKRGVEPIRLP